MKDEEIERIFFAALVVFILDAVIAVIAVVAADVIIIIVITIVVFVVGFVVGNLYGPSLFIQCYDKYLFFNIFRK